MQGNKRSTLGEKLTKLRHEAALSTTDVCAKLGVNRTSLFKWEHNLVVPHPINLHKLAELYNVPVTDLTKED